MWSDCGVPTHVIAGFQPEVAMAIVQFSLDLEPLCPALDVDEALALLRTAQTSSKHHGDA
jgi:hypothetical protein